MSISKFAMRAVMVTSAVLCTFLGGMAQSAPAALTFIEAAPAGDEIKGQTPARLPAPASPLPFRSAPELMRQNLGAEVEPNGTFATATPIAGENIVLRASVFPATDQDFYAVTAQAGDRLSAAVMTGFSAGNSTDSQLTLLAPDGTTVIEFDDDNGSSLGLSSAIAGATLATAGTYFLRVNDFTAATGTIKSYELHLRLQRGAPVPEVEANDTPATANPLPADGWVSGARNPAAATEQDWYSLTLNAGDTVYLALDLDPERDGVVWNGRLGFALFGDAANQILVVDDAGTGDVAPNPVIPSEAMFFTVKTAGTYFAFVDSATAATAAHRHLSSERQRASATDEGVSCRSTPVPTCRRRSDRVRSGQSTITVPAIRASPISISRSSSITR